MRIAFQNKIYVGSNGRQSLFDCSIPDQAKAVIVFVHGYKGFKDWGAWHLMESYFLNLGYGFVKLNLSHNGGTTENPIDFPDLQAFGENTYTYEIQDLNVIIDETDRMLRQECEMDIPIYLLGHSRGGGVAVLTTVQNQKVAKVVSMAGISDIGMRFPTDREALNQWEREGVMYVKNGRTGQDMPHFFSFYLDFQAHADQLNIEKACARLTVPFMQVHGDMDLAVSISEGQAMAAWTETELTVIKGADHTFGARHPWRDEELPPDFKSALQKIAAFFDSD